VCFVDPRPPLEGPQNTPVALSSKQEVNMTFCGPARDTVLTNRQTGKLNFDTCYIIIITYLLRPRETVCFVDPRPPLEGPQNTLLSRGLSK
jgi:hypothetical protein